MNTFALKFIKEQAVTGGSTYAIDIPAGSYAGVLVRFTGTTTTGQIVALSGVGNLRLQRAGKQVQGATFQFFHELNDLGGGFMEETLATAGANAVSAVISASAPGMPNVMDIRSNDEADLFVDVGSAMATYFGANAITMSVWGLIEQAVPETYQLQVDAQNIVASAAGDLSEVLSAYNVSHLAVMDAGSVVSYIQASVGGKELIARMPPAVLKVINDWTYKVESSGAGLLVVPTAQFQTAALVRNDTTELRVTFSGAGTLQVWTLSVHVNADKALMSAQRVRAQLGQEGAAAISQRVNPRRVSL